MKSISLPLAALTALCGLAATAHAAPAMHLPESLTRVPPAYFASRTTIDDDRLEQRVVLSTQRSGKREGPARGAHVEDAHARIIVDRATGAASREIWYDIAYVDARRDVAAVHYLIDGKLHRTQPRVVEHWLDQCPAADVPGQCNQMTRIVFELPEDHARAVAAKHRNDPRQPWLIRFKDRNGASVTVGFPPAEMAGLEDAYAGWRQTAG